MSHVSVVESTVTERVDSVRCPEAFFLRDVTTEGRCSLEPNDVRNILKLICAYARVQQQDTKRTSEKSLRAKLRTMNTVQLSGTFACIHSVWLTNFLYSFKCGSPTAGCDLGFLAPSDNVEVGNLAPGSTVIAR